MEYLFTGTNVMKIINVNLIEYNEKYKLSDYCIDDKLFNSISNSGVLKPIIVEKINDKFVIISGHNRFKASLKNNFTVIPVIISENHNKEIINNYLMRDYEGRISSYNKLKFFKFINDSKIDYDQKINLPEYYKNYSHIDNFFTLDKKILKYFKYKNVNFKTIESLQKSSDKIKFIVSDFLISRLIKTNILKEVIELLNEIERFSSLDGISFDNFDTNDIKKYEIQVIDYLKKLRFPEYTKLLKNIQNKLSKYEKDFNIKIPEYFEGNSLEISKKIKNLKELKNFKYNIEKMDTNDISEVLNLF